MGNMSADAEILLALCKAKPNSGIAAQVLHLMRMGVSPTVQDSDGNNAIDIALSSAMDSRDASFAVVNCLFAHGACFSENFSIRHNFYDADRYLYAAIAKGYMSKYDNFIEWRVKKLDEQCPLNLKILETRALRKHQVWMEIEVIQRYPVIIWLQRVD